MALQSQTLSLAQRQQLQMVLAPQLRQSLEMLQVPLLELRAMVQQEIEQNPTIEERPLESETVEIEPGNGQTEKKEELDFDKEFEALAKLDEEWRDYFFQELEARPYSRESAERRQFMLDSLPQQESLQEHLVAQLRLSGLSEPDKQVGNLVIGSIDEDGYLATSIDELAMSAGVDEKHLEDVLSVIQEFHPTGIGSRDLRECLLLQIEKLDKGDTLAADIVRDHLDTLASRKLPDIAKALKISIDDVQEAAAVIAGLDPKPGRVYTPEVATYVFAEVVVQKIDGEYVIMMNDDQLPHLRISKQYRSLLNDEGTTTEVKSYVRERIRSGAFLIKSIHQRQKTIYRIAEEIVKNQVGFLDNGIAHLKPMTMAEVAAAVGVHETTVSRAVSSKYMKTPAGMFEMKYFFTPGIKMQDGTQVSNKSVQDMIATMIADEDPAKPLSDQEIAATLKEQGVNIARRTIAKYRLVLRIPASHMRKQY